MLIKLICLFGFSFAAIGISGCGDESVTSGTPSDVDMTKDYSPKVDMPGMSPKEARTANKKK